MYRIVITTVLIAVVKCKTSIANSDIPLGLLNIMSNSQLGPRSEDEDAEYDPGMRNGEEKENQAPQHILPEPVPEPEPEPETEMIPIPYKPMHPDLAVGAPLAKVKNIMWEDDQKQKNSFGPKKQPQTVDTEDKQADYRMDNQQQEKTTIKYEDNPPEKPLEDPPENPPEKKKEYYDDYTAEYQEYNSPKDNPNETPLNKDGNKNSDNFDLEKYLENILNPEKKLRQKKPNTKIANSNTSTTKKKVSGKKKEVVNNIFKVKTFDFDNDRTIPTGTTRKTTRKPNKPKATKPNAKVANEKIPENNQYEYVDANIYTDTNQNVEEDQDAEQIRDVEEDQNVKENQDIEDDQDIKGNQDIEEDLYITEKNFEEGPDVDKYQYIESNRQVKETSQIEENPEMEALDSPIEFADIGQINTESPEITHTLANVYDSKPTPRYDFNPELLKNISLDLGKIQRTGHRPSQLTQKFLRIENIGNDIKLSIVDKDDYISSNLRRAIVAGVVDDMKDLKLSKVNLSPDSPALNSKELPVSVHKPVTVKIDSLVQILRDGKINNALSKKSVPNFDERNLEDGTFRVIEDTVFGVGDLLFGNK